MILTGLAIGALLGIVMQRGRFCVTGMLRDIFLQRSYRTFTALLVVIAVHAVGLAALTSFGVITPELPTFKPIAVVIGGILFGIGIIAAGGCASGTWYRSGEGLIGSWVALIFYALSAAMMKTGALTWLNDGLKTVETPATGIAETVGINRWWLVIGLALVTAALVRYYLQREDASPTPVDLGKKGWRRPLHVYTAAVLVGIIGVIAWPLSAATGRNSGLGITTPSSDLANFLVVGNPAEHLNWGVMLVLGILVGSFVAAKSTGEFRLRVPDTPALVRSVGGGSLMGIGASLAGGCTVGNGMVQTSLFSWQGWIALAAITAGVWIGVKIWLTPRKKPAAGNGDYTVPEAGTTAAADPETKSEKKASAIGGFSAALGAVSLSNETPSGVEATEDSTAEGGGRRVVLDSLGAVCPFPLLEAKQTMAELNDGDQLVIDFDCTQATDAIPRWAANDGHEVVDFHTTSDAGWQITLLKHGAKAENQHRRAAETANLR